MQMSYWLDREKNVEPILCLDTSSGMPPLLCLRNGLNELCPWEIWVSHANAFVKTRVPITGVRSRFSRTSFYQLLIINQNFNCKFFPSYCKLVNRIASLILRAAAATCPVNVLFLEEVEQVFLLHVFPYCSHCCHLLPLQKCTYVHIEEEEMYIYLYWQIIRRVL